jgi:hypothetical protein
LTSILIFLVLMQSKAVQQGHFDEGFYTTCPAEREIHGLEDMFVTVDEPDLLRLAKSKPVAKCPIGDCRKQTVKVDVTVHDGEVSCVNAKDGKPELQKAAVEAAMQMKFKKTNTKPFYGITGILTFTFQ